MFELPFDPDSLFPDASMARERRALSERWRREGLHDGETLPGALARAALEDADLPIVLH